MSTRSSKPSSEQMVLANALRMKRVELRMTQDDVAAAMGKSHAWVSLMERGRVERPPIAALRDYARALHMDDKDLIRLAGFAEPPPRRVSMTRAEWQEIASAGGAAGANALLRHLGIPEGLDGLDLLGEALMISKARRSAQSETSRGKHPSRSRPRSDPS